MMRYINPQRFLRLVFSDIEQKIKRLAKACQRKRISSYRLPPALSLQKTVFPESFFLSMIVYRCEGFIWLQIQGIVNDTIYGSR
jgi:hypothetical protein